MRTLIACLLALSLSATRVVADEKPEPRTISVSGHSEVSASPDLAVVSIAVETTGATAGDVIADNAKRSAKVAAAVKSLLVAEDKVTTTGYSLEPRYENTKPGQTSEPKIVGYVARNEVQVETHKIDQVGSLIDAAITAGGNRVSNLSFGLSNRNEQLRAALERAGNEARAQAESIAKSLGVKLTKVLRASSSGAPIVQPRYAARGAFAAMEARPPTPIEPGSVSVSATLEVTYEIE